MNELETLKEVNCQLKNCFALQDDRIKKLEEAIRNHQIEMQNHWLNASIDEGQVPDLDTNKKLWKCL